jgi:hypothetical protein
MILKPAHLYIASDAVAATALYRNRATTARGRGLEMSHARPLQAHDSKIILAHAVVLAVIVGCSGEKGGVQPQPAARVTSLSLDGQGTRVSEGDAGTVRGRVIFSGGAVPPQTTVGLASSDTTILNLPETVVATNGEFGIPFSSRLPGTALITARVEQIQASTMVVIDSLPVSEILVSPQNFTLDFLDTLRFSLTFRNARGRTLSFSGRVAWQASNLKIDSLGSATAQEQGEATVLVSAAGVYGESYGNVVFPRIVRLEAEPFILDHGLAQHVQVRAFDARQRHVPTVPITFVSADTLVASLVSPVGDNSDRIGVKALRTGSTTITAQRDDAAIVVPTTVRPNPVRALRIEPLGALYVGNVKGAAVEAKDAQGRVVPFRQIQFVSNVPSVASISTTGEMTAIAPGSTTITATIDGVSASATLTVLPVPFATSVTMSSTRLGRVVGQQVQLNARIMSNEGQHLIHESVTWTTSNSDVATVSSTGIVTALRQGTADIVAVATNGVSGSTRFTIVPDSQSGPFSIELWITKPASEKTERALRYAAARLSSMITRDETDVLATIPAESCLPDTPEIKRSIDDLLVMVSIAAIDDDLLAVGGPCWVDGSTFRPIVAVIVLNERYVDDLSVTTIEDVALHEMLHAMGMLSSIWLEKKLLYVLGADAAFVGPRATAAFHAAGGTDFPGLAVPVDNTGPDLQRYNHWRFSAFEDEIFVPTLFPNRSAPLSGITVSALGDLGYGIDTSAVDAYRLPAYESSRARTAPGSTAGIPLKERVFQPVGDTRRGRYRVAR